MSESLNPDQQRQKAILTQAKIANVQLAALNLTNLDIAASNRRIEAIQRDALDEAKRQTAVLELQLEETKLAKLERTRQVQLKQAAFSLNKEIDLLKDYKIFSRLILIQKTKADLAEVSLNAEEMHEINDKEYTHAVLTNLDELQASAEEQLSEGEKMKISEFQDCRDNLLVLAHQIRDLQAEKVQTEAKADLKKHTLAACYAKKSVHRWPIILFAVTLLPAILIHTSSDTTSIIESVGEWCQVIAFIICPIWLIVVFLLRNLFDKHRDKEKILQLTSEIKLSDEKVKEIVAREIKLRSKLEASSETISKTLAAYPELKAIVQGV